MTQQVASGPEQLVIKWLDEHGFQGRYSFQTIFGGGRTQLGGMTLDFLIKDLSLAIRIQGTYYHQGTEIEGRDLIQKQQLMAMGLMVVDVWEHDLYQNIDQVMELAMAGQELKGEVPYKPLQSPFRTQQGQEPFLAISGGTYDPRSFLTPEVETLQPIAPLGGGDVAEFTSNEVLVCRCVLIDTDKVVVVYRDNTVGTAGYAVVGTIANFTITWGTPSVFAADVYTPAYHLGVAKLGTDKFVVVYAGTGDAGYARVGTVSGTTITWGDAVQFESGDTEGVDACQLDADKFFTAYNDEDNSDQLTGCVCTVSDSTVSPGTPVVMAATKPGWYVFCCALTSTKAVLAFIDSEDSNYPKAVAVTIADTTPTPGTAVTVEEVAAADGTVGLGVARLSDSTFVMSYLDEDNTTLRVVIGTVTGDVVTFGDPATASDDQAVNAALVAIDSETFIVAYEDYATDTGKVQKCTVSGTTITVGTAQSFNHSEDTAYIDACLLDSQRIFVCFQDDADATDHGEGVVISGSLYWTFYGRLIYDGGGGCTCYFLWGKDEAYNISTAWQFPKYSGARFSHELRGAGETLVAGQAYCVKAAAYNEAHSAYGAGICFLSNVRAPARYVWIGRWAGIIEQLGQALGLSQWAWDFGTAGRTPVAVDGDYYGYIADAGAASIVYKVIPTRADWYEDDHFTFDLWKDKDGNNLPAEEPPAGVAYVWPYHTRPSLSRHSTMIRYTPDSDQIIDYVAVAGTKGQFLLDDGTLVDTCGWDSAWMSLTVYEVTNADYWADAMWEADYKGAYGDIGEDWSHWDVPGDEDEDRYAEATSDATTLAYDRTKAGHTPAEFNALMESMGLHQRYEDGGNSAFDWLLSYCNTQHGYTADYGYDPSKEGDELSHALDIEWGDGSSYGRIIRFLTPSTVEIAKDAGDDLAPGDQFKIRRFHQPDVTDHPFAVDAKGYFSGPDIVEDHETTGSLKGYAYGSRWDGAWSPAAIPCGEARPVWIKCLTSQAGSVQQSIALESGKTYVFVLSYSHYWWLWGVEAHNSADYLPTDLSKPMVVYDRALAAEWWRTLGYVLASAESVYEVDDIALWFRVGRHRRWEWKYEDYGDKVLCIAVDKTYCYCAGESGEVHQLLVSDGTAQWTNTDLTEDVTRMAVSPGGDVYAVSDGELHKINAAGVLQWSHAPTDVTVKSVAVDSGNDVYIGGSYNDGGTEKPCVHKIDSDHAAIWDTHAFHDYAGHVEEVAVDPSDVVYVAIVASDTAHPGVIYKLASDDGDLIWQYEGEEGTLHAHSVDVDWAGQVFCETQIGADKWVVEKLTAEGVREWCFDDAMAGIIYDVAVPNPNIFAAA